MLQRLLYWLFPSLKARRLRELRAIVGALRHEQRYAEWFMNDEWIKSLERQIEVIEPTGASKCP